MEEEMARSLTQLKFDDFPPPYYVNYQIRDRSHHEIIGGLGALLDSTTSENRSLYVEVRVGSPKFDSSTLDSHEVQIDQFVPLDNDLYALKRALWYETDLRYKQAIMNLIKKKGRLLNRMENYELPDFSPGNPPVVRIEEIPKLPAILSRWKDLARKVSARFIKASQIEKSRVKFTADQYARRHLDSDGNRIQDNSSRFWAILEGWTKTETGFQIHDEESVYFSDPEKFPSEEELARRADRLIHRMNALTQAQKMEPYIGPAIFSPEATAILFHEAIGHRLEADRLRTAEDGRTLMKKVGQRIIPPFLTVADDPRMRQFQGKDLAGSYLIDDQGQKSEEAILIEQGILKSFLLSRSPIPSFNKTNGHARSDGARTPMSRMGNLIIRSQNALPAEQLKRRLIEEVKRQNKPFGLIIKKMISGETQTEARNFQIFKGKPLYLYKVYPEDGREEMARGVEFLGTPLSLIDKIIVTGDDVEAVNGFCEAESGSIPVTTITPSALLSEVELQTSREIGLRRPLLPPPSPERLVGEEENGGNTKER
ncbi:MAG: hypothetical protein HY579_02350 [Nitrospinae bacterium]|nr:hypothetical protein [Nitrospinota bacterium]